MFRVAKHNKNGKNKIQKVDKNKVNKAKAI